MAKNYKSSEAKRIHTRPIKEPSTSSAKRVGSGKYAHPQPRGPQEKKGKR